MSRHHSYLRSAKAILEAYRGEEPFASFLKKTFAANKKFGSKDRKTISQLCYSYFRTGKMLANFPIEERILAALFLCTTTHHETLAALKPDWAEKVQSPLNDKIILLPGAEASAIFPFNTELSEGIDRETFRLSHLVQPDLFLRLRPGKETVVKQKLETAGISYESVSTGCLALPTASKADSVISLNAEAVVQDYSSQRVQEFFPGEILQTPGLPVWDCCAASGGKSLLLYDRNPSIDLTVSDLRESIIANLKKRFREAGISRYKSHVMDVSTGAGAGLPSFKFIIADVPCSGSGTWGRAPEQLVFFTEKKIDEYASLQKRIGKNVLPHLQKGGYLLYITCSVFKKENEEAVEFICSHPGMQVTAMQTLRGYDKKADTMFAALIRKES